MCDQDHFEDDRKQFEALGAVTRKQFGIMLGAGMAMMLPQVANAVTVAESDVNVKTPDGTAEDRKSVVLGKECRSRWSPYH